MLTATRPNQSVDPFDGVFNGLLRQPLFAGESPIKGWAPAVDVVADSEAYRFRFDIPGVSREQLQISIEDRVLTVSGEREDVHTDSGQPGERRVWRSERNYGKFSRAFRLPSDAQSAEISARYENGVLEVVVPKAEEVKARRIEITA